MVEICVPLAAPPVLELWDGSLQIKSSTIREYALWLQWHLFRVASLVELLQNNGWVLAEDQSGFVFVFEKSISLEMVEEELFSLGVAPDLVEVYDVRE